MQAVANDPVAASRAVLQRQDRADVYALLSALLLAPEPALLAGLAQAPPWPVQDDPATAEAWELLCDAAARCDACAEFDALFVAAGTPPLNPYQSFYLSGCLMDKPLAQLRDELRALGLGRAAGATELEDHLGALCEAMRVLIEQGREEAVQARFLHRHLAGWAAACLADLQRAPPADFYRALAGFALHFLGAEAAAFELELTPADAQPSARARRIGASP